MLVRRLNLAALAQDGRALQYASADLKAAREVVLAAVARNGSALEHAAEGLRLGTSNLIFNHYPIADCADYRLRAGVRIADCADCGSGVLLDV